MKFQDILFKKYIFLIILVLSFAARIEAQSMFDKVNDFDGDGKTDCVVTRNENGLKIWYIRRSNGGFSAIHWGLNTDTTAAGDYDGDGKTDLAVVRQEVVNNPFGIFYRYYILQSQSQTLAVKSFSGFSSVDTRIVAQDYDGDGKTDPTIWQSEFGLSSSMRILQSSNNSETSSFVNARHLVMRIGDIDGDGRADTARNAVDSPYTVILDNIGNSNPRTVVFGTINDIYVPADFDGDNKGDLTFWRSGNWFWLRSLDNTMQMEAWGSPGDIPLPGDYDGDGKTDRAVRRTESTNAFYYINGSQSGFQAIAWGLPSDSSVRY